MKFEDVERNYEDVHLELCRNLAALETDLKIIKNQYERAKNKYELMSNILARKVADYTPTDTEIQVIEESNAVGSANFSNAKEGAIELITLQKLKTAKHGDLVEANGQVWKLCLEYDMMRDVVPGQIFVLEKRKWEADLALWRDRALRAEEKLHEYQNRDDS